MKRVIKTCYITLAYCVIWMLLEMILYGNIDSREVDDIMMLLFIPIIYRAVGGNKNGN